jgi:hypothetical protein
MIGEICDLYSKMGSAGFEPTTSSARGWHHTKLDYDPLLFLYYTNYVYGKSM